MKHSWLQGQYISLYFHDLFLLFYYNYSMSPFYLCLMYTSLTSPLLNINAYPSFKTGSDVASLVKPLSPLMIAPNSISWYLKCASISPSLLLFKYLLHYFNSLYTHILTEAWVYWGTRLQFISHYTETSTVCRKGMHSSNECYREEPFMACILALQRLPTQCLCSINQLWHFHWDYEDFLCTK